MAWKISVACPKKMMALPPEGHGIEPCGHVFVLECPLAFGKYVVPEMPMGCPRCGNRYTEAERMAMEDASHIDLQDLRESYL